MEIRDVSLGEVGDAAQCPNVSALAQRLLKDEQDLRQLREMVEQEQSRDLWQRSRMRWNRRLERGR